MDVTFAAYGARVAESLCDRFDRFYDVAFSLCFGIEPPYLLERPCGKHRPGPGSEILRRKLTSGYLAEIRVYIARVDAPALAFLIDVLKQFLARKLLAALHDFCYPAIVDVELEIDAALAAEFETDSGSPDFNVFIAHDRETK